MGFFSKLAGKIKGAIGGLQTGPRGGKFYKSASGEKVYGEPPKGDSGPKKAPPPKKATPPKKGAAAEEGTKKAPPKRAQSESMKGNSGGMRKSAKEMQFEAEMRADRQKRGVGEFAPGANGVSQANAPAKKAPPPRRPDGSRASAKDVADVKAGRGLDPKQGPPVSVTKAGGDFGPKPKSKAQVMTELDKASRAGSGPDPKDVEMYAKAIRNVAGEMKPTDMLRLSRATYGGNAALAAAYRKVLDEMKVAGPRNEPVKLPQDAKTLSSSKPAAKVAQEEAIALVNKGELSGFYAAGANKGRAQAAERALKAKKEAGGQLTEKERVFLEERAERASEKKAARNNDRKKTWK